MYTYVHVYAYIMFAYAWRAHARLCVRIYVCVHGILVTCIFAVFI